MSTGKKTAWATEPDGDGWYWVQLPHMGPPHDADVYMGRVYGPRIDLYGGARVAGNSGEVRTAVELKARFQRVRGPYD